MKNKSNFSNVIAGCMRLGTWGQKYSTNQYLEFIEGCIDLGVTTFDHADIYGDYTTESEFGAALKEQPSLRNKLQLISKCGIQRPTKQNSFKGKAYNSSPAHIIQSVDTSLKNLNTDYLDLLLLHRPDVLMDAEAIAETFTKLKEQGKVKAFGVSNFTVSQMQLIHSHFPIVANQIEVSLFERSAFDNGVLDFCYRENIEPMAWSPLGGGEFVRHPELFPFLIETITPIRKKYNATIAEVLYAFIAQHPANITSVTGTSKVNRVKEAQNALKIELTREEFYALWQAEADEDIP